MQINARSSQVQADAGSGAGPCTIARFVAGCANTGCWTVTTMQINTRGSQVQTDSRNSPALVLAHSYKNMVLQ